MNVHFLAAGKRGTFIKSTHISSRWDDSTFFSCFVPIPNLPQITLHGIFDFPPEGRGEKHTVFHLIKGKIRWIQPPPF